MPDIFELKGRVALVTGAASGIGRAVAVTLYKLGVTVIATDLNEAGAQKTIEKLCEGNGMALGHDVTRQEDWDRVVRAIDGRGGRLDILVNNAGIMLSKAFMETSYADFRKQQTVNVDSIFLGMQACVPLMIKTKEAGGSPSIINLSSVYGQVSGKQFSAYSTSKGAVRMLSRAVAVELAPQGIRVNTVFPGPTLTRLGDNFDPPVSAEDVEASIRQIPLARMGLAQDIAGAIAFLASDASVYMTGSELNVDGGYTAI